jgi:predicted transport protein
MNRNIALVRYRRYADLLLLEQLTATSAKASVAPSNGAPAQATANSNKKYKTITSQMAQAPENVLALYDAVAAYLEAAGEDVQVKTTDFYIAFRRLRNFACVELRNQLGTLLVFVRVNPDTIILEDGFTRDMRGIGHFGTGDLEISIGSMADFEKAKPLFDASYQNA